MNTQANAANAPQDELVTRLNASLMQRAKDHVDAALLPLEGRMARELGEALQALAGPTIKGAAVSAITSAIERIRGHAINSYYERLAGNVIEQLTNGQTVEIPGAPRAGAINN